MRFLYRCIYLLLGVLLGPAACPSAPAYGPPPADLYLLDGQVVAAPSGAAIPGIMVDFHGHGVLTQGDGSWQIRANISPSGDVNFLEVRDIDGEENGGLFAGETVLLDLTYTSDDTWEQHDISIDLDPAQ